jgi:integrase
MTILKIPGVKRVKAKGRVYHYHRATRTRIAAPFGTAAFLTEIEALDAQAQGVARIETAGPDGTLGGLVRAYRAAPEWRSLALASRVSYERVFEFLRALDDARLETFTPAGILRLRDRVAERKAAPKGRWIANYTVKVLRLLFAWGRPRDWIATNPAADVKMIARPRGMPRANRPWTAGERAAVLDAAPAQLKAPIALGMFTGAREGDAIRMTRAAWDGKSAAWRAQKNGREIWVTAHPRLVEALTHVPADALMLCLNARGRAWTQSGFRASFFKLIRALEAEGKIGAGLTFHGLRHTLGDALAEAGCTTEEIEAVLGVTPAMARHYSQGRDRRQAADRGIARLKRQKNGFWKTAGDKRGKPGQ